MVFRAVVRILGVRYAYEPTEGPELDGMRRIGILAMPAGRALLG